MKGRRIQTTHADADYLYNAFIKETGYKTELVNRILEDYTEALMGSQKPNPGQLRTKWGLSANATAYIIALAATKLGVARASITREDIYN